VQSTSHISPWIAAFSKNVDNPGTASEHSEASLDLPIGLGHRPRDGSVVSSLYCMNDPQPKGHMASYIRRREFIALLGGAGVAWPLPARAQQPALPVVGVVGGGSADGLALAGFRKGLNEIGYVEGQNVTVEYYWLECAPNTIACRRS